MPKTCLPPWGVAELPEPRPLGWRNWKNLIGPGIVMMGIQIGGGEWLLGPETTARYGGGLMWVATVAIVTQVFYNLECGRYALYCGEPILTGFLRLRPGPLFWVAFFMFLSIGSLIPGLSTQAAAVIASFILDRPPGEADRGLVMGIAYACLAAVILPVLFGGKVYNMLQAIMTVKVIIILFLTVTIGILFVSLDSWLNVLGGFFKFGSVPVATSNGGEIVVNAFSYYWTEGRWPAIALGNIAVLGAFAGYAGGGGLSNSAYSNYVRDQGWGMGSLVGAIPSAVGGKQVSLSHLGKIFPLSEESLRRWRGWWKHVLVDQFAIWMPGCFVGMALPSLLSMQFAASSPLYAQKEKLDWTQAVITADGLRHASGFSPGWAQFFWLLMLFAGLMVLLPSQMSIVDDFSRRWTDVIWSANRRVRERMEGRQVRWIYYLILAGYTGWSLCSLYLFTSRKEGNPKLMILIIANLNNVTLGFTAFSILWINWRLLPKPLRPRWYNLLGMSACGVFYLGLTILVLLEKQWPLLKELLGVPGK